MTSSAAASPEELASMKQLRDELHKYMQLFVSAFEEVHAAVLDRVNSKPGQYIRAYHDYPRMAWLDSGFPSFNEMGFFRDDAPRQYVTLVLGRGLLDALVGGHDRPSLPKLGELAEFLRTHEIGKKLKLEANWNLPVELLVADAVERYLHLHGLHAPIVPARRDAITDPLVFGTVFDEHLLRLVVPITLTHFEVDHFRLTSTAYIARIPKKLQLARARMSTLGTGAVQMVVGAATHAFVSTDWSIKADSVEEVRRSLNHASSNVLDAVDSFFGALRVVTGIGTGYAQLLWVPRHWTLDYFCDLTPVYGTTLRRYPAEYDNYGWTVRGATVTAGELKEVRRIYQALVASPSEAVRLAVSRLNGCLTRSDPHDAILDGTIGLELLLGDDQNQSLAYKLRLRAAALALLAAHPGFPAAEVASKVKRLYEARSAIVHGRRKKRSKSATEPSDASHERERLLSSDLLRFVLNVLLTNPEYQDPARIDAGLLLRGDSTTALDAAPKRSNRRRRRS